MTCDKMRLHGFFPSKSSPPDAALASIQENLKSDITPCRNLGSFITTSHSDSAIRLLVQSFDKNQACMEEYPSVTEFKQACISILADLWNTQPGDRPYGLSTSGSSEAVLLAGISMKQSWMGRSPTASRPNVVFGSNAHVCVLKFAQYFDVEPRIVPVNAASGYVVNRGLLEGQLDRNTIGVFLTLGNTYTGHCDPISDIARYLDEFQLTSGLDIPVHVDGASGGFVAPFSDAHKSLVWDFRLRRVVSINTSGHKFGFAPCTVGWVIWRDRRCVPESLMLESSYLCGSQSEFTLSFSRSGAPVVGQYYNFVHLGKEGYRIRITKLLDVAKTIACQLETTGYFSCLSTKPLTTGRQGYYPQLADSTEEGVCADDLMKGPAQLPGIPVVVFAFSEAFRARFPAASLADVSDAMLKHRFAIPCYHLPGPYPKEGVEVMRMVIREDTKTEAMIALRHLVEIVDALIVNRKVETC